MESVPNTTVEFGGKLIVPPELVKLVNQVRERQPDASIERLIHAYEFASKAHTGVYRLSGAPYITHCLAVTEILSELRQDITTLCAGLLHDVIEDTKISKSHLETEFGSEVARLVEGVTKISTLGFGSQEERHIENLRKMILAMAQDIRVILIKISDRLHNMRTLQYLPYDKQIRIATDTIDIYAPLAHRLGMGKIKWELEDLSLRFLKPEFYSDIQNQVAKKRREREQFIDEVILELKLKLSEMKINARIEGRPKHFYSIYQKMSQQNKSIDEIFDLTAIRVITDNLRDCYAVLGIVHTLWKPIQGRFKDYIAMPKSNMYQSLHTTVWGKNREPLEIQIRTQDMHRTAEYGIAAHWLYKEGKSVSSHDYEKKFVWLRQLLEDQQDMRDPKEFMESLKIDLFTAEIFVFTPKGEVKELPIGATPVDFAYAVHTEVGNHCIGAKVNGQIVQLRSALNTGDIVEIITSKTAHPSRDWLSFIKTSRARNKITHYIKHIESEEYTRNGKESLARELKAIHVNFQEIQKSDPFLKICQDLGFTNPEDLFISIGTGKLSAKNIVNRLYPTQIQPPKIETPSVESTSRSQEGIRIKGVRDALIRFGKCCLPVPGDPIIGFITRGRGISIHKKDCMSIAPFLEERTRIVEVEWDKNALSLHMVPIKALGEDRQGLLRDILDQITNFGVNVTYTKAQQLSKGKAQILLTLEIIDTRQLNEIIKNIRNVKGILEVQRTKRVK